MTSMIWVYAVTTDVDPAKLSDLTGVAGEPVRRGGGWRRRCG
jgi:hypothetical protein